MKEKECTRECAREAGGRRQTARVRVVSTGVREGVACAVRAAGPDDPSFRIRGSEAEGVAQFMEHREREETGLEK